jgi:lipopolysaccharide assembly protein A
MRWLNIIVVALFALATALFAIQNLEIVTLTFLGISARVPLALLVVIIYVLGMATGGSLFALLRRSIARSRFSAMSKS